MARASGARVVVLTPALHNPTGACMGERRRREIAAVVERLDLLVVEDDVYGALGDQPPLLPLLGRRGLLVSSLSKTVCAGLRLGWIAGDETLLAQIDPHAQATHWQIAPLMLAIAGRWIDEGSAERKLAWQREEVQQRWRLAQRLLGAAMRPGTPSPHVWLEGPRPGDELAAACRARGVEVVPAQVFAVKQGQLPAIRISLTAARSRAELKQALERVARVLEEFSEQDPG